MKHIVGFSGGIDSQAVARLTRERFGSENVILLNSEAGGNEDPLTTAHVDEYSATVHPVVKLHAINADMWEEGSDRPEIYGLEPNGRLDFPGLIARKGVPTGKRKTCTYVLKLMPQRRWIRQTFGVGGQFEGEDFEIYTGLRRDESTKRRGAPDREWGDFFDCWVNHPIASWTKEQCFEYVADEPINPLYRLGFNRVGCAPCVESNKGDILNWALRRPEMIDKIDKWEQTVTLPGHEQPGFNWFPIMSPTGKFNSIREVVDWAKTKRGGRQTVLPIMHDRPSCESKYGLCE